MTKQDMDALQKSLDISYDNGVLRISLAGNFVLRVGPAEDGLSLSDASGNALEMSQSGISLTTKGKLTLSGETGVSINGSQGVSVTADAGDVAARGSNVTLNADIGLTADAGTSASVQGGAELSLRGDMIMIN